MRLRKDELEFLRRHHIPRDSVEDLRGLPREEWRRRMREMGALVSLAGAPCKAEGHRLRVTGGQCAQCNTRALSYTQHHRSTREVYVAYSKSTDLFKIGNAVDAVARRKLLSDNKYGGVTDWTIVFSTTTQRAGDVETRAQGFLADYRVRRPYRFEGRVVYARELFQANKAIVMRALKKAIAAVAE